MPSTGGLCSEGLWACEGSVGRVTVAVPPPPPAPRSGSPSGANFQTWATDDDVRTAVFVILAMRTYG